MRQYLFKLNMISIEDKIVAKVKKAKRGSLFFVEDFLNIGSAKAVAKVLERFFLKSQYPKTFQRPVKLAVWPFRL